MLMVSLVLPLTVLFSVNKGSILFVLEDIEDILGSLFGVGGFEIEFSPKKVSIQSFELLIKIKCEIFLPSVLSLVDGLDVIFF